MRIPLEEARAYWMHPTQHSMGFTGNDLPDWADYWADSGVCIMAHRSFWPGIVAVHIGVLPEAWGNTVEPTEKLLREIWRDANPTRIIAHVHESNRLACRLCRKVGAEIDGRTPIPGGSVIQYGWK